MVKHIYAFNIEFYSHSVRSVMCYVAGSMGYQDYQTGRYAHEPPESSTSICRLGATVRDAGSLHCRTKMTYERNAES